MIGTGKFSAELPTFKGSSDEKWKQLESYLYRMTEQLRFAFSNIQSENLGTTLRETIESKLSVDEDTGADEARSITLDAVNISLDRVGKSGFIRFLCKGEQAAVLALDDENAKLYINAGGTLNSFGLDISAQSGVSLHSEGLTIDGVGIDDYIKAKAKEE